MGRSEAMSKKVRFLGAFVTSVCEESVYLPAIVSNLGRYVERAQRVRIIVDQHGIRVKERRMFGGSKTDRIPLELLCVAHMCVTIPELVVFVVRSDWQHFKAMAFLCKKPRHVHHLIEATSAAKLPAGNVVRAAQYCDDSPSESGAGLSDASTIDSDGGSGRACRYSGSVERWHTTSAGTAGRDRSARGYRVVEIPDGDADVRRRPMTTLSDREAYTYGYATYRSSPGTSYDRATVGRSATTTMPRYSSLAAARRSYSVTDLAAAEAGTQRNRDDLAGSFTLARPRGGASVQPSPVGTYRQQQKSRRVLSHYADAAASPTSVGAAEQAWVYAATGVSGQSPARGQAYGDAPQGSTVTWTHSRRTVRGSNGDASTMGRYDSLARVVDAQNRRSASSMNRPSDGNEDMAESRVNASSLRRPVSPIDIYSAPQRGMQQTYHFSTLPSHHDFRREYA